MMDKRTYYHGTWSGNVPSIKEEGLRARTLEDADRVIDNVLSEYGETRESVPRYYWYYSLLRLRETAGQVWLSGDRDYAVCNCLAGFEGEVQLRSHLEARVRHSRFKFLAPEEALKREMPCSVCEVQLDESDIPEDMMQDFKDRAESATLRMPERFPTQQVALDYILSKVSIVLKNIEPDKIKECEFVGRREEAKKCGLKEQLE